ncbi:MAG: deoxyguanosinetriphosphate triphosphohydrolase, partial [Pseudomonadota bacterium]
LGRPVIAFSDAMVADLAAIRAFLFERMYRHWRVARMRRKAADVVRELFEIYLEHPGVLPDDWREAAQHAEGRTGRARLVSDYIAGMTDRFALQEHRQLTDPQART